MCLNRNSEIMCYIIKYNSNLLIFRCKSYIITYKENIELVRKSTELRVFLDSTMHHKLLQEQYLHSRCLLYVSTNARTVNAKLQPELQYLSCTKNMNKGHTNCTMSFSHLLKIYRYQNMCNLKFPDLYMPKYPQNFAGKNNSRVRGGMYTNNQLYINI